MSPASVTLRFDSMLHVVSELKIEDQSEMLGIPKEIEIYDKKTLFDQPTWEGLKFPMIAKPLVAYAWAKSHEMALVFNHDGLKKDEVNRRRRSGDKSASEVLPLMKLLSASCDASTHVNATVALLKVSKHGNDRIVINECGYLAGRDNKMQEKDRSGRHFRALLFLQELAKSDWSLHYSIAN